MLGTDAVLGFLDAREKAALCWVAAIFILALVKSDGFVGILGDGVRAVLAKKLLIVFGSAALYTAVLLWIADDIGLWHFSAAKASAYWFFGTGIVLVARAAESSPVEQIPWSSLSARV